MAAADLPVGTVRKEKTAVSAFKGERLDFDVDDIKRTWSNTIASVIGKPHIPITCKIHILGPMRKLSYRVAYSAFIDCLPAIAQDKSVAWQDGVQVNIHGRFGGTRRGVN